jgi:hypothetical protein
MPDYDFNETTIALHSIDMAHVDVISVDVIKVDMKLTPSEKPSKSTFIKVYKTDI